MAVADNCALHSGPEFSLCEVNARPMSKKRLKQFVLAVGGDPLDATVFPNNLNRYEPENAIVILLSRRYVNETSLVLNPTPRQSFPQIKFKNQNDFGDARAMVINGHGRIVFIHDHLCRDTIAEYTRIDKALKASRTNTKSLSIMQVEVMTARRIELIDILRGDSSWLVAVYDLGELHNSKSEQLASL